MSRLAGRIISQGLRRLDRRLWLALTARAADPATTQQEVLQQILSQHAGTTYGIRHHFESIKTPAEFAEAVPVNDYNSLRPAIEQQEKTGEPVLTNEEPAFYARTSGTTGEPKYLPVTPSGLKRQATAQRLVATLLNRHLYANVFSTQRSAYAGRVLTIASPAAEGYRPHGKPYGSASGLIVEGMPALVRSRYILTPEISAIADHDERYYAIARASLAEPRLAGIGTANPSTLLRLRQVIIDRWDDLLADVSTNSRKRASALAGAGDPGSMNLGDLWPMLEVVTTWTKGSCELALDRLRPHLPPDITIFEMGYTASELRGSVPIEADRSDCLPLLGDVFFEFVERTAWERGDATFLGLAELQPGTQYYVFVTTIDGLYRYDMNDIVEAVSTYANTPTISFVQKGKGVTNITGEKLAESQVIEAVRRSTAGSGAIPGFFVCIADAHESCYRLYVEGPLTLGADAMASLVEGAICTSNIEYSAKLASGRLRALEVRELVSGTAEAYRRHCLAEGQRDAQLKILHLQTVEQCGFDLDAAVVQT